MTDPGPLLEVRALSKRFGRLVVVDDLGFDVAAGEALGVVGPNGAGKSTMLDLIAGVLRADAGEVRFGGSDVTALAAADRCRAGIGRSYQIPRPFTRMTVFENVLVGARFGASRRGQRGYDTAYAAVTRAGLEAMADRPAGSLRLLDLKRLELARALATDPKLILLDEIAGGLSEAELPALVESIRGLRDGGVAVIWIEHIVHALLAVVDRLMCLTYGRMLALGDPQEVIRSPEVVEVYLGSTVEAGEGDVA